MWRGFAHIIKRALLMLCRKPYKTQYRAGASAALILLLMVTALSAMFLLNADGKALPPGQGGGGAGCPAASHLRPLLYLCNTRGACRDKYMYMIFLLVICFQLSIIFSACDDIHE